MIPQVANHLWQSTLFAAVAALLALALRRNHAQVRYWLWLAASLKFLVPFSLLVSLGGRFEWRNAPRLAPPLAAVIEPARQPAAPATPTVGMPAARAAAPPAPVLPLTGWFCGFAFVVSMWHSRWRRIRAARRTASRLPIRAPIEVMSSPMLMEPGVFGVFRPVLVLPEGIADRLAPAQLRAILAHELCHVRRRDNLAAAVHMLVEAVFWFHPLVWWIGARLIEERERACDEEVLRMGNEPESYAQGILNVCKFYLESPLACAPGVTGADLKKRIEAIMTDRISNRLTLARKLLLAAAGATAVAGPVFIGALHGAQAKPEALTFEVASIKPGDPDSRQISFQLRPGGGLNITNVNLQQLIAFAYNIPCGRNCDSFITGGPGWMRSARFDIVAKSPQTNDPGTMSADQRRLVGEQVRQRTQALLADRFQLVLRRETREMPVYALVVAKNGPKLTDSPGDGAGSNQTSMMRAGRGELNATGATTDFLAKHLAGQLGRPVLDRTGLKGKYDFKLEWTPEPGGFGPAEKAEGAAPLEGPSLFTAIQEQLGLKLESTRGPVEIFIVERAEKPSEN